MDFFIKKHKNSTNFLDHQYSQPTAEVIPETLTYTNNYGPLDLTTYFIYATAIIAVTYVSFK